tara:strand:+ start:601 stop:903 length:303 start_codon:yes stop_codon:yes gene_type:complete
MTKKLIYDASTNISELVDLTSAEQTTYDNAITAHDNNAPTRALNRLREKRNKLLVETDYLALSDLTMSSEMEIYRQALRNITNGLTTVEQIEAKEFPTKP